MSRVGKAPVEVPASVKVSVNDREIAVEGPKGKLSFTHRAEVLVEWNEGDRAIVCSVPDGKQGDRVSKALWGTTRAIVGNMIQGVTEGYQKKLHIEGVGWNATASGNTLELNLGFAVPVRMEIPQGLTVTANKQEIVIQGSNKQQVGAFAARVRSKREPEPYNAKGIRYNDEVIRRKQGKQFGA